MTPTVKDGLLLASAFLCLVLGFLAGKVRQEAMVPEVAPAPELAETAEPPLADPAEPEPIVILPVRFDAPTDEAAGVGSALPALPLPSLQDLPWLKPSRPADDGPGVNLHGPEPVIAEVTAFRRANRPDDKAEPLPMPRAADTRPAARRGLPLTGCYPCRLADRAVLEVPAAVRDQLAEPVLYLRAGSDGCLWLAPACGLEKLAARTDETRRRLVYAWTVRCEMDANGHLTLPESLAQSAGLSIDVMLVGAGDHFELWDACRWQSFLDITSQP